MQKNNLFCFTFFVFYYFFISIEGEQVPVDLTSRPPFTYSLLCGNEYKLSVYNVTSVSQYILFHAHSQWNNIILSERSNSTEYGHYSQGTDVGLLKLLDNTSNSAEVYLTCAPRVEDSHVTVLLYAYVSGYLDPIPGGCNLEFSVEEDPNLLLDLHPHSGTTTLKYQYANIGSKRMENVDCELYLDKRATLGYYVYERLLPENDFSEETFSNALADILSLNQGGVSSVLGRKVVHTMYNGVTSESFALRRGHGVIYTVLVAQHFDLQNHHALYVPTHTYGCQGNMYPCFGTQLYKVLLLIVLTVLGVLGLIVAFYGHRLFMLGMSLFGHLGVMLIALLFLVPFSTFQMPGILLAGAVMGLAGGVLWPLVWYFTGAPLLAVLMPAFSTGFISAAVLLTLSPLGDLEIFENGVNFGLCFAAAVLVLPVVLIYFTKLLNLVCCAVTGSFLLLWAVSMFLSGSFKHMIPDTLYKLTSAPFRKAYTWEPYTAADLALCCVWVLLVAAALCWQLYREKDRPPFPPCPHTQRRLKQEPTPSWSRPARELQPSPTSSPSVERDPLLRSKDGHGFESHSRSPGYGSLNSAGRYGESAESPHAFFENSNPIVDPI